MSDTCTWECFIVTDRSLMLCEGSKAWYMMLHRENVQTWSFIVIFRCSKLNFNRQLHNHYPFFILHFSKTSGQNLYSKPTPFILSSVITPIQIPLTYLRSSLPHLRAIPTTHRPTHPFGTQSTLSRPLANAPHTTTIPYQESNTLHLHI